MPRTTRLGGASYPIGIVTRVPVGDGTEETAPPSRPPRSANKARWVDYADALGVDSSGTKDQIIARLEDA